MRCLIWTNTCNTKKKIFIFLYVIRWMKLHVSHDTKERALGNEWCLTKGNAEAPFHSALVLSPDKGPAQASMLTWFSQGKHLINSHGAQDSEARPNGGFYEMNVPLPADYMGLENKTNHTSRALHYWSCQLFGRMNTDCYTWVVPFASSFAMSGQLLNFISLQIPQVTSREVSIRRSDTITNAVISPFMYIYII